MTPESIIEGLTALGVRVWAEGDRLKLDAPAGVLTEADVDRIKAHKAELLEILRPVIRSQTREEIEAHQLLVDLQQAGCGFHIVDDELRMANISRINSVLWLRFEEASPEFRRRARELAESMADRAEDPEWVH